MQKVFWFGAGIAGGGALTYALERGSVQGVVASGCVAALLVVGALYFERREQARRSMIAEQLAAFLDEGASLRRRADEDPLPVYEHNAWVDRVGGFLREQMGKSHETRFNNFSGMTFLVSGGQRGAFEKSIEGRSRRLHEFMAEIART